MLQKEIKFEKKSEETSVNLSSNVLYQCNFCQKVIKKQRLIEQMSGNGIFCTFCIRNNHHTKNNKNILPLSFKAIIGFYHQSFYKNKIMYLSEIEDYVLKHIHIGNQNPVFKYDEETLLWFIDFSRVGKGRKRMPISEVLKTINSILHCFNLHSKLPNFKMKKLYEKYEHAIKKFHSDRYRPDNKRILLPSLDGCTELDQRISHAETKKFSKKDLESLKF